MVKLIESSYDNNDWHALLNSRTGRWVNVYDVKTFRYNVSQGCKRPFYKLFNINQLQEELAYVKGKLGVYGSLPLNLVSGIDFKDYMGDELTEQVKHTVGDAQIQIFHLDLRNFGRPSYAAIIKFARVEAEGRPIYYYIKTNADIDDMLAYIDSYPDKKNKDLKESVSSNDFHFNRADVWFYTHMHQFSDDELVAAVRLLTWVTDQLNFRDYTDFYVLEPRYNISCDELDNCDAYMEKINGGYNAMVIYVPIKNYGEIAIATGSLDLGKESLYFFRSENDKNKFLDWIEDHSRNDEKEYRQKEEEKWQKSNEKEG